MVSQWKAFYNEIRNRLNPSYFFFRLRHEKFLISSFIRHQGNLVGKPRFSIVVPTYGIELQFLKEFVRSVQVQSYTDWELCICEDGDPDSTIKNFLRTLAQADPKRVRLVQHPKNRGIIEGTKSALALAKNEFVVLTDADDLLHPRALEVVAAAINNDDKIDFLYTNHDYLTEWGFRLYPVLKPGWSPELLLHVNYINHLKVIRTTLFKEVLEKSYKPDFNGAQDWSLCFQVMQNARKVKHIPLVLYHWRMRPGSMASDVCFKPWAIEAQVKLRSEFIESLDGSICFEPLGNRVELKSSITVTVLHLNNPKLTNCSDLTDYIQQLRTLVKELETEVVFFDFEIKLQQSELSRLAAYCLMPRIAGVWPFNLENRKIAYTTENSEPFGLEYVPFLGGQNSFCGYSGNVLAGPLNGMMCKRSRLLEILNTCLENNQKFSFEGRIDDACGILISLTALKIGFRNVSANVAKVADKHQSVRFFDEFFHTQNPYI